MSPKEQYDWEWDALPNWAKRTTMLVGLPAFAVLTWSVFDERVTERAQAICFTLFAAVSLMQIYCLNRIIRKRKRRP